MKKVNFNQIKGIKTPESWIENALNIPIENKKPKPFYLKPYFLASAASVVICCALSLYVFSHFGSDLSVLPVATSSDSVESTCTTKNDNSVSGSLNNNGNNLLFPDITNPIMPNGGQPVTEPYENKLHSGNGQTNSGNHGNNQNTQQNSNAGGIFVKPTHTTAQPQTDSPEHPTQAFTQPSVQNTEAAQAHTSKPAKPVPETTKPTFTEPSEATVNFEKTIYFYPSKQSNLDFSGNIYCRIEIPDSWAVCEDYSETERCSKSGSSSRPVVSYTPKNKMQEGVRKGSYYVIFYDEHGNRFTQQCDLSWDDCVIYE